MNSHWRRQAQDVISAVIREHHGQAVPELRKLISAAWPPLWGPRKHHPYKIWLSEIRYQLDILTRGWVLNANGCPVSVGTLAREGRP